MICVPVVCVGGVVVVVVVLSERTLVMNEYTGLPAVQVICVPVCVWVGLLLLLFLARERS